MSEKRFVLIEDDLEPLILDNKETMSVNEVVDKLNEQQELIEELHISDHMGWGRAEKFEKELKQKKIYIKRLEYKVQKFKEMNGEQQATIHKLQDLCGESDGENAKLRIENKKLKEEKGYWKGKAMTLFMQVRRLTPRMSAKEVIEFGKELDDE